MQGVQERVSDELGYGAAEGGVFAPILSEARATVEELVTGERGAAEPVGVALGELVELAGEAPDGSLG
jgi:hypothetical protein